MNLLRAFRMRNGELGEQRAQRFEEVRERIVSAAPDPQLLDSTDEEPIARVA